MSFLSPLICRLIIVATRYIPLQPLTIVSIMVMWESSQWLEKKCAEYWRKRLKENMDRYIGRRDISEIMLKTALNTINSFNQSLICRLQLLPIWASLKFRRLVTS